VQWPWEEKSHTSSLGSYPCKPDNLCTSVSIIPIQNKPLIEGYFNFFYKGPAIYSHSSIILFIYLLTYLLTYSFIYFVVLGFELKALHLLGRPSTT
jgi:hypothetical protein